MINHINQAKFEVINQQTIQSNQYNSSMQEGWAYDVPRRLEDLFTLKISGSFLAPFTPNKQCTIVFPARRCEKDCSDGRQNSPCQPVCDKLGFQVMTACQKEV